MKLGVIGAGAWGTALAVSAVRAGSEVVLWSRSDKIAEEINNLHLNTKYLGHIAIAREVAATCDIARLKGCDAILMVVPAQELRGVCRYMLSAGLFADVKARKVPVVISSKGVERESLALMSEVIIQEFSYNNIAILSGPNFADEVAKGLPACATLACVDKNVADRIFNMLCSKLFRLYYSDDIIGAQIAGAVKNVIAIASGIGIGKGFGENARAAIVTRGIAEIGRLAEKLGGKRETLLGLCGIGDIMLTCASEKSRNFSVGMAIGSGGIIAEIINSGKTVEGVQTAKSVYSLAQKYDVEMPITKAVKELLYDATDLEKTVEQLLERPLFCE